MLLKIEFDPKTVVHQEDSKIILRVNHYAQWSSVLGLETVSGKTYEDFRKNETKLAKALIVGINGGIVLDKKGFSVCF